jgi:hypothetical protein
MGRRAKVCTKQESKTLDRRKLLTAMLLLLLQEIQDEGMD